MSSTKFLPQFSIRRQHDGIKYELVCSYNMDTRILNLDEVFGMENDDDVNQIPDDVIEDIRSVNEGIIQTMFDNLKDNDIYFVCHTEIES